MKKTLAILLAVALTVSLCSMAVSAAEVPDDAFDGGCATFEGSDGSKTSVYDNGCVMTEYPDGTKTGVDYNGNEHQITADGTYAVKAADGTVATEYADGTRTVTTPSGSTTTYNTDGTSTETSAAFGTVIEYDAEGKATSIGFVGSEERIKTDDDGCYESGTITGPNGATMSITENGITMTAPDGKTVDYSYSSEKESTVINRPDGTSISMESNVSWTTDDSGSRVKVVESSTHMDLADGGTYDGENTLHYDENGSLVASAKNVEQFTDTDGSYWWNDRNSSATSYRDANGNAFITDKNGNLERMKTDQIDCTITYDEDGNVYTADITFADGTTVVQAADGRREVILPEGGYVIDTDGTMTATDGTPTLSSELVYEYNYTGTTSGSYFTDSAIDVPADVSVPTSGWVPSVREIVGTYSFTGTNYFLNETQTWTYTFSADPEWPQKMTITDIGEWDGGYDESYDGSYDPTTGICYCSMPTMYFVFSHTDNGGIGITAYMYLDGLIFQGSGVKQ